MIKSSTKHMKQTAKKGEFGVIICYTSPGQKVIKQAAKSIRNIIQDNHLMFYKNNRETEEAHSQRLGYMQTCNYMYIVLGRFYKRDELGRWILMEDNEENVGENLQTGTTNNLSDLHCSFSTCIKKPWLEIEPPQTRPSHKDLMERSSNYVKALSYFKIVCDVKKEDTSLTELERVWMGAKELLKRGVFNRITHEEMGNKNSVLIVCHAPDYSDITECFKEIRKNICYPHPIFFKQVCKEKPTLRVMHTAEGEFYKRLDGEANVWEFIPLESYTAL